MKPKTCVAVIQKKESRKVKASHTASPTTRHKVTWRTFSHFLQKVSTWKIESKSQILQVIYIFLISTNKALFLRKMFWTTLKTNNFYKTEKNHCYFVLCFCQIFMHCFFIQKWGTYVSLKPQSNLVASQLPLHSYCVNRSLEIMS